VLIDYGSIAGAGFGSFALGKLPPRMTASLVDNAGNTSIDLNVTAFDAPKWTGNGDKTWNTSSTNNWQLINGGTPTTYQEDLVTYSSADNVTFDDSTANGNVTVNATVSPGSITVTNSSTAYTFTGSGAIAGSPSLTKTGSSSLTFVNTGGNTLGAVSIGSGSTVTVGDGVTTGVGFSAGGISNAGTLNINRPDNGTISAAISGVGNVSHTGSGTTTLSGASSYTGTTDISNGVVKITAINNLGATGTGAGQVNISGTGALDVGDAAANSLAFPATKVFHISGGGFGGNGTIISSAPDTATRPQNNAFNKITLDANATIGGTGRFDIRNNSAVLDLAGFTLTKKGSGQFSITGTTVNDGNIDVQGGTLSIETTSTMGGSGTITYEAGTTGQFFRPTGTVSRPMVVNGATLTDASQTNTVNITSPLTFGGSNSFSINSSTGFTFSGNINETVSSSVTKNGAGTMVLAGTLGYTGTTTVNAGKLVLNDSLPSSAGVSVTGGTLQMAANQMHAIKTASVAVTGTGKLDINDNKLITTAQGVGTWNGTAYDGLTGQIAAGYSPNQDFSGNGVVTSQTTATGGNTLHNIGVASNSDLGLATFGGVSVGANDTLAMFTYGGDANLDGAITGDDYFQIDSGFPAGAHGWFNGDFNYDGSITGDDYFVIDSNFSAQGSPIPTSGGIGAGLAGVQAVPEPASIGLFAVAGASMLARRRRRNGRR
jgi:autotransporter-associated beta strand protein